MATFTHHLTLDHKRCDRLFADAEHAVDRAQWQAAESCFDRFAEAMRHHLKQEETVLFPAFESRTGSAGGPTEVMRQEHAAMRGLIERMGQAIACRDAQDFLGRSETLLILMQQHNVKEEQILYRMADRALAGEQGRLLTAMHMTEEDVRSASPKN